MHGMRQRFQSFIQFSSRRASNLIPGQSNLINRQSSPVAGLTSDPATLLVAIGALFLVLLVIDLAISGGLQMSVGGRSMDEMRSNVEDFAMQFYNR